MINIINHMGISIIQDVTDLRDLTQEYVKWFEKNYNLNENGFGTLFNNITMLFEILTNYYIIWNQKNNISLDRIEAEKEQNFQRVILITKWTFIGLCNAIKTSVQKIIVEVPNNDDNNNTISQEIISQLKESQIVSFETILNDACAKNIIDKIELSQWRNILHLIEILQENNGISDVTETYHIDSLQINLKKGEEIQGNMSIFIKLSQSLTKMYYEFLKKLL